MGKFVGHYNELNEEIQTLHKHSESVAVLCSDFLKNVNLSNLGYLCGILHDFGKSQEKFRKYIMHESEYKRGEIDHSTSGGIYINERSLFKSENKLTSEMISLAIFSHHSYLLDMINSKGDFKYNERLEKNKDIIRYDECKNNFINEICSTEDIDDLMIKASLELSDLMKSIKNRYVNKSRAEALFEIGLTSRLLYSSLIDADRYDTSCFFRKSKVNVIENYDDIWDSLINRLEKHLRVLNSDSEINIVRNKVSDKCKEFSSNPLGIYQLYAPTGYGKTLSSLRFALYHAKNHKNIKRIIYVIPFLSIVTQNAKSVREILEENDESIILEHYSNLIVENEEEHKLLTERWDRPIIFTTYVQLLNTLFDGKSQSARRMHQLTDSILIFDEIQSLPVSTTNMFNTAMNFISQEGHSTVLLCSATQPILNKTSRAIQLSNPNQIIEESFYDRVNIERVKVIDMTIEKEFDESDIATFVLEKMITMNSCLIVMNKKDDALKVYKQIVNNANDSYQIYYLSTNLCSKHREDTIKEIFNNLKIKKVICVSTNIISAGVDLSFEFAVRSCVGLDNILQVAGRCNRNGEMEMGYVYIIRYKNEDLDNLKELKLMQEIAITVLNNIRNNSQLYENGNILSKKAINEYYYLYYRRQDKLGNLNFAIEGKRNDLYDLLSTNSKGVTSYKEKNGGTYPDCRLRQAFCEAGYEFKVMDTHTTSVIVPYGYGIEIINQLLSIGLDYEKLDKLLKAAQPYSVELFDWQLLNNTNENIKELGVRILDEKNYDKRFGFNLAGESEAFEV
ncbi:MAG: CRISPR-associated helicase Cas3' [Erysipelotrichaceae bacterium]